MEDYFSVFDYNLEDCTNLINKTTKIHDDQKLQGFFSEIGMSSGDYLNFQIPDNLVIIGDLHGDFKSLEKIVNEINYGSYLKSDLNVLIFLGDYVDRGQYSLEVLLLICKLKTLFPNNVFMLRGNHEAYNHFPFSSYHFPQDLMNKFAEFGHKLYSNSIVPFFESLFTFCEINEFSLIMHAGLPVIENVEFFKNYKFYLSEIGTNKGLLEEIIWNDPREFDNMDWEYSNRGLGKYFGVNITNKWLDYTNSRFVIRGHEPCTGYKLNHDGKVVTIFSSKEPYPRFESSYLKITRKEMDEILKNNSCLNNFIHII